MMKKQNTNICRDGSTPSLFAAPHITTSTSTLHLYIEPLNYKPA